jgi:integrase
MKGNVSKYVTASGQSRWRITYDLSPDPQTGKRRQTTRRGFTREKDAHAALRKILGTVEDGTHVPFDRQTVEAYLREWLDIRKPREGKSAKGHRGRVGIGTWSSYGDYLEAYVIPRIGQIRLQHLTPGDLNRLYDELERSGGRASNGLSAKTVANVHGIVHKALADAVKQGRVAHNAADRVDPPRADKPSAQAWSTEQLRAFVNHIRGDRLCAMWLLFATTGMRRGEVAGLCWSDLDLDAGCIRISWTLGVVDSKPTWKQRPKSEAGERTMALDPVTVEALAAWRRMQLEEHMAAGPGWQTCAMDWRGQAREHLVFTWPDGRMINPERISKWFANHCMAAGLPKIRLHDVRHSYATAGLANATGWHEVKVISQRLGHASVGITLDTYSHVLPAADEQTAHTLARIILGTA